MAEQDAAALEAALVRAQEAGVGQAAYVAAGEVTAAAAEANGGSGAAAEEAEKAEASDAPECTRTRAAETGIADASTAASTVEAAPPERVAPEMVIGSRPLVLRMEAELSSAKVTELPVGTRVLVLATRKGIEGTERSHVRVVDAVPGTGAVTSTGVAPGTDASPSAGSGGGGADVGGREAGVPAPPEGWLTSFLTSGVHSLVSPEAYAAMARPGSQLLAECEAWLRAVQAARARVADVLRAALDTAPSALDTACLQAEGVEAAATTGGIDADLLLLAQTKLESTLGLRTMAVAQLKAVQAATLAEQV